jgi:hypothetical protein
MKGLLGKAGAAPGSEVEHWLSVFLSAGWVRLGFLLKGTGRVLDTVVPLAPDALEEFARPGVKRARTDALADARLSVAALQHPVAREIARILRDEASGTRSPALIRALCAVARHVDSGDTLAERVFSTRYLEDSKALGAVRNAIERLVGPLDALGIREGAALTLVGGNGSLVLEKATIDLPSVAPFIGLSREALIGLIAVQTPPAGLLVVENLANFDACCRGEVDAATNCLILWSAGYPGRGVRQVIETAGRGNAAIRVWADLDFDGVQIARQVAESAGGRCTAWRMAPADLLGAAVQRPLDARARSAIRRDLDTRPDAMLSDTLSAMLSAGYWVEQEAFLGR